MQQSKYFTSVRMGEAKFWGGKRLHLARLDVELTERCNNNCIHCCINIPDDDSVGGREEMSTEQLKGILTEAAILGCTGVKFSGGEPLLREDFEELYRFARKLGLRVLIFTNATLITPRLAELFTQIPAMEKIEVSVYGMKEKSYEAVTRTQGAYEAAWRGIHLLLEKGIPFVVKGTLLPPTKAERAEFESWASTIPGMDDWPGYSMFFDLRFRRDSETKNRLIKGFRYTPEEGIKFLTRNPERYLKSKKRFCSRFVGRRDDKLFACSAGVGASCVDAYGYLQPCTLLKDPKLEYNLKDGSIKDALTSVFRDLREMRSTNPDYLARCARCFLRGLCEQCPGKSWVENGTLDTPVEYLCEIAHAHARYCGLVADDEMGWEVDDWRERIEAFSEEE